MFPQNPLSTPKFDRAASPAAPRRAFSLVEVLMAIGLVTFALLVIFSLMPAGLAALQGANRQIVETEIFNTIGAELASTPFQTLDDYVKNANKRFPVYFDNEGIEVPANSPDKPWIFVVNCNLADPEAGNAELRRATVSIGYKRESDPKPSKRTFLLVNRGI